MSEDELEYEIACIRQDVLRFKFEILIPFLLAKYQEKGFNPSQLRIPAGDPSGRGGEWAGENVSSGGRRGGRSNPSSTKPHGNQGPPKETAPPKNQTPQPTPRGQNPVTPNPNDPIVHPKNPRNSPNDFKTVRGNKNLFENIKDGSWWSKDTSRHGGEQWKRWSTRRDYDLGRNRQSIWTDGRIRGD